MRPFLFSAIHLPAKVPSWMSDSTARIRALVSSWGMTRGPLTYSPNSAVSEMEKFMAATPPLLIRSMMSFISWMHSK